MTNCIKGYQLVLMTFAVSLGIFMNILDTTIANVAIPNIAGSLAVSPNEGTWVITSFAVSMAIVLPLTGWLGRRFGEVRLFVTATLLFTLASVFCGLSHNLTALIFFRVMQGAVAGPMIPLSQSLLLNNFPEDKKGFATGLWAMVAVAAPVLGPILGGHITDNYSWPWIFYINVPIGLFSAFLTWKILKNHETPISHTPIDYIGLILLVVGIGSLQVLLDRGHDLDWFKSDFIVTLACTSVVSLTFLIIWELTETYPIIDLRLFGIRNFSVGTTAISIGYGVYFGSVVILPLWLQTQMNYTAEWAGLVTAPLGILPMILSPVIGVLVGKIDPRILVSVGFGFFGFCSFWQAGFATNVDFFHIAIVRFIQGAGAPFFFIPTITILLSGIAAKDIASAAGLSNFLRILAGSFGTSISVSLWATRESIHQSKIVEKVTQQNINFNELLLKTGHFPPKTTFAQVHKLVVNQAYMMATNDIFWISGYIFISLFVLIWLAKPPFLAKAHLSE